MAKLFRVQGPQAGLNVSRGAQMNPRLMQGPGRDIQAPYVNAPQDLQPVRIRASVQPVATVDPISSIINTGLNFAQLYFERSAKIKDEEDRLNASEKARMAENELRTLRYGDEDNTGYLQLQSYEAKDRRKEFASKGEAVIDKYIGMAGDNQNEKRHLAYKLLPLRAGYMNDVGKHYSSAVKAAKQEEERAKYGNLLQRLDDKIDKPTGPDMGEAMAEIAAYTHSLPPGMQVSKRAELLNDFVSNLESRDPKQATPLLKQFQRLAQPVLDINTQARLNKAIARSAARSVDEQEALSAQHKQQMVDIREMNDRRLRYAAITGKEINVAEEAELVKVGHLSASVFDYAKSYAENERYLPLEQPEDMAVFKRRIIDGKMDDEEISTLGIRRNQKNELLNVWQTAYTSEMAEEKRHYANYVDDMIRANTLVISGQFKAEADVVRNNAVDLYFRRLRDPENKMSPFEVAKEVLKIYRVDLDAEDPENLPAIAIPGEEMIRPRSLEEVLDAAGKLREAKNTGRLNPGSMKMYQDILRTYHKVYTNIEMEEARRREAEAQQPEETGFMNWLGEQFRGVTETSNEKLLREAEEIESGVR